MSNFTETLDPHYYRDAVQRSTDAMAASSNREHRVHSEPCVSIYMPEGRCSFDGRPDTVAINWGTAGSVGTTGSKT